MKCSFGPFALGLIIQGRRIRCHFTGCAAAKIRGLIVNPAPGGLGRLAKEKNREFAPQQLHA